MATRHPARRGLALLASLAVLGGCALTRPGGEAEVAAVDWAAREARLAALPDWQARGRIAVKSAKGGGQGDMQWRQAGPAARIRVSGPFGAGAYEIRWDPGSLSVTSRNGAFTRQWDGPDAAEAFLSAQLGWAFPATSTRWWLLGLPDPGYPAARSYSPRGELARLEQNGWTITYERYGGTPALPMPARLTVENPQARLRVVVDDWCLEAACLEAAPAP
jgi:outer membrane lipoprotein LolB